MTIKMRPLEGDEDFWRIRTFLREAFLANDRRGHSRHVARLDYWRWHLVLNCHGCKSVEEVMSIWETRAGNVVAALNPVTTGEIRLHVHPDHRSAELEDEMVAVAEERLCIHQDDGGRILYLPVDPDDALRQRVLPGRGFAKRAGISHKWRRDLEGFGRLQRMGCTCVMATAFDRPADALDGAVLEARDVWETWLKVF